MDALTSASEIPRIAAYWTNTAEVRTRLRNRPAFFEEQDPSSLTRNGIYQGRHIIGRDTIINGGVYVGSSAREAIVVDDISDPELQGIYQSLLDRVRSDPQGRALSEVFAMTGSLLPYNAAEVDRINSERGVSDDGKISLVVYINAKAGVCRHQALLAGYLLQRLKADGYLRGDASVDRNYVPGLGGHAWVRYTNSAGEVTIIDVAQDFIGSLEEIDEDLRGFYERPEDV